MSGPRATAVIAAAGSGQRLGAGGPKAFVMLAGRPLIEWSLEAIGGASSIGAVIVAAPPEAMALADHSLNRLPGDIDAELVEGGSTRAESVAGALERVTTGLVAIHDAARPLAPAALFDAVLARLAERDDADGVIAATPIADTVKRVAPAAGPSPRIDATVDREPLWAAQTPQAFRAGRLRDAIDAAGAGAAATDEAALVERAGGTVLIEAAGADNLKVTTPADVLVAEALLRARSGS